jgi:hypothetical protein
MLAAIYDGSGLRLVNRARKHLPLSKVITHQFYLGQIKEAVGIARSRQGLKIMIYP